MIHLYYGDGQGKTSAAMGLALRAWAAGWGVHVVQFLKDGTSGEVRALEALGSVRVDADGPLAKFTFLMDDAERAASRELHDAHLRAALAGVRAGATRMLVLDEVLDALAAGLLDEALVREALSLAQGDTGCELALTGHGEPPAFVRDAADYVTRAVAEAHPYDRGVPAREGVEY